MISVLMILRTSLEAFHLDQQSWSLKKALELLPLAVCGSVFKIGTLSIAISVLRFNVFYVLLTIVGIWFATKSTLTAVRRTEKMAHIFYHFDYAMLSHAIGLKKMTQSIHILNTDEETNSKEKYTITTSKQTKNLFYSNLFWFIIYSGVLITCLLLANWFPDTELLPFFPLKEYKYVLSNLPLIQNFRINIVGCLIWFCGALSLILIYLQLHNDLTAG